MKRLAAIILALCLLLSGCGNWLDGSYVSVEPHEEKVSQNNTQLVSASSYSGLKRALLNMVYNGTLSGVISVANYNQLTVSRDTNTAIQDIMANDPIGAYALEGISFELGTNAGKPAIAVKISYYHDRNEIKKIQQVGLLEDAQASIREALDNCDSGIVLYIEQYEPIDLVQWVQDYSERNLDKVMELPQVTVNVYPDSGSQRILELKFLYQNSRDSLRTMQEQVETLAAAAAEQVSGDAIEKFAGMYTYLMTQVGEYQLDTSLTPAYSLLVHGVGDAKAFAAVYAALCRRTGLECIVVTGTRDGEPWSWNMILCDGVYYHVDLLRCAEQGEFMIYTGEQMSGYYWLYESYPSG